MKNFKNFINENITDLLKGKSDDEIRKELSKLNIFDRIIKIRNYTLSDIYLPTDEDIRDELKKYTKELITTFDEAKEKGYKKWDICRSQFWFDSYNYVSDIYFIYKDNELTGLIIKYYDNNKKSSYTNMGKNYTSTLQLDFLGDPLNDFLNENFKDLLKPKSKEEILKTLPGNPNVSFIPSKLGLSGTYLLGFIETSYEDLENLFGQPIKRTWAGNIFSWVLKTTNGRIVTIYDNGSGYSEDELKNMSLFKWHVGGQDTKDKDNLVAYVYNKTLNENFKDLLKPKTKEEILKILPGNPNTKFERTEKSVGSGGLRGTVLAYYEDLVKLFGKPKTFEYEETYFQWKVISENNNVLEIYDYETYVPEEELLTQLYNWHIGGSNSNQNQEDANDLIAYIVKNTSSVNENFKDLLKPKSKEEILKSLLGNPNTKFERTEKSTGGGRIGRISCYYENLVKLFGEPDSDMEDDKTYFNWNVISEDGHLLYIYDYKEYDITINDLRTDIINWHIGGINLEAANDLIAYIIKNTIF